MLTVLNNLNIKSVDIENNCLNAKYKENVHVMIDSELFGKEHKGKTSVIVRALYGLRSNENAWRSEFSTFITNELRCVSSMADPEFYIKTFKKPDDSKYYYYSYLIIYVDDILCIHHNQTVTVDIIQGTYRSKQSIEDPKMYIGTDMRKWYHAEEDGTQGWC